MPADDVWALGAILHELLAGSPLYPAVSVPSENGTRPAATAAGRIAAHRASGTIRENMALRDRFMRGAPDTGAVVTARTFADHHAFKTLALFLLNPFQTPVALHALLVFRIGFVGHIK